MPATLSLKLGSKNFISTPASLFMSPSRPSRILQLRGDGMFRSPLHDDGLCYKLSMNRSALHETRARSVTNDTEDSAGETLPGKPRSALAEMRYSFAIQVLLLVVWHQEWEHRIVFSVNDEQLVAQLVKGILTTFITLYSALLVFVTQSLALRQDLHTRQLLTATHDNAVAWSGLGSAVVRLWQQHAIPASPIGVLTALTYLAGISALHTAFPGVAAPQSLVVNQSVPISTQSLPAFDLSGVNETNTQDFLITAGNYAGGSLYFLPFVTPSNTLGLHEAPCMISNLLVEEITIITTAWGGLFPAHAVFYTSIPVLDSNNNTAPWTNMTGTPIQVFRCSLGLVEQAVLVDSQSRNFTSFASGMPPIEKHTSIWMPFSEPPANLSTEAFADGTRGFLDIWEAWYTVMPPANPSPLVNDSDLGLTVADMALLQLLELYPLNSTLRSSVYLHEVENQLAKIVASMFWTLGHVPVPSGNCISARDSGSSGGGSATNHSDYVETLRGLQQLNIISIVECLVASLVLLGLSSRFSRPDQRDTCAAKIGLDVLQIIWLYRDHPEINARLEQVQVPTDENLRQAGMFQVQLIDGAAYMRDVSDSEEVCEIISEHRISVTIYPPDKQTSKEPERLGSTCTSDLFLSLLSTVLHFVLVVLHLLLGILCTMKLEYTITFSLSQQSLVAWLISTVATAFITIYTAGLVFLTQTLSIRRSLRKTQMLTVTHDTVTAWRGVGSAFTSVFHQTQSLSAVIPVLLYLVGILALHITSPALFAVQVFNSTVPVPVRTQGIPIFAFSGYEPSSLEARMDALCTQPAALRTRITLLSSVHQLRFPTLGLEGGMLYEVLNNSDSRTGIAVVKSVQFNMSCGYISDPVDHLHGAIIAIRGSNYSIPGLGYGKSCLILTSFLPTRTYTDTISTLDYYGNQGMTYAGTTLFYSIVPIVDSAGNTSPLLNVSNLLPGEFPGGLVNRTISVDSQSQVLSSPGAVQKKSSVWSPVQDRSSKAASAGAYDRLAYDWESLYAAMPDDHSLSVIEMFFAERFNLDPNESSVTVTLHQFEDALAEFVASMYWTMGHIPPPPGYVPTSLEPNGPPPVEVSLLQGNTVLFTDIIEARLDANMSFIILGTAISGVLFLISLHFSSIRKPTEDEEIISGMGPLHIIWLYRNHPELEEQLEQVVDPTTSNLRKAGMVRTRDSAVAIRSRDSADTTDPRTPIPLFCVTEIDSPDGWWAAHSPASIPFLPIPLSGTPARPRKRPRRSNGCGSRVHADVRPVRTGGRWLGGRVVVPLETRYFDSADAAALGLRGGPGCGCTVDGVGCAICGNPLGTVTTPCRTHRTPLASTRRSTKSEIHYTFLPTAVSPPISTQQTVRARPRSPSPLRSLDAEFPGDQPPPLIAASPIPEDEQELGEVTSQMRARMRYRARARLAWSTAPGTIPPGPSASIIPTDANSRTDDTAPGMSSTSLSLPAATMDPWLVPYIGPAPYVGPAPVPTAPTSIPIQPSPVSETTPTAALVDPTSTSASSSAPRLRRTATSRADLGVGLHRDRPASSSSTSSGSWTWVSGAGTTMNFNSIPRRTPPSFPSVSEQEAWLAVGSSGSGTDGGEGTTTRRKRASVPYLREPLAWGEGEMVEEQEGVMPMDVDSEAQGQGETSAGGLVHTVTVDAGGGSVHVVDGEVGQGAVET
ncbi:hypothetical protein FB45DRAFT_1036388 [Roridomyces roridus]|uniref:Transmembrane protein n=1 Tax=Roridomyces roridus TaxID=1738132 RepID=A0AAD7B7Y0_9AGAR|nr:hypothetical protein FB45DRAFT_1036388 [Roridomyces roridus]